MENRSLSQKNKFDRENGTLVITGASGFLGRQLVPLFADEGYRLLLCGRDPEQLSRQFPGFSVCSVEELPDRLKTGSNALLHLSVMNSNQSGSEAAFVEANVNYLETTLTSARAAGVVHVVYPSSFHAIEKKTTAYARSKAAAENVVTACRGLLTTILRLPAVYGTTFQGRLSVLNRLPAPFRRPAFHVLHSLRAAVDVKTVFSATNDQLTRGESADQIVTDNQDENPVYRLAKRTMDLTFVLVVVLLLWWLLVLIWVLVRLTSPGPGLFVQDRVGHKKRVFRCFKFRTMHLGTQQVGTHDAPVHAITRVGGVLRRLKLDELPQIWNLLRGEMTLVGPRPCLPVQDALIDARARRDVFELRPGVSGLAQINGVDMSTPEDLAQVDAEYAKKRTLIIDIKIILATLPGVPVSKDLKI